ncbi:MAG TPA: hypothetical protein VGX92_14120 [Pyrinomonadaceae bacterium]|nr:hypothetical protein [Pyrinomonadaceae bacterium]
MTYLVAAALKNDLAAIRQSSPEVWRQVRRYNLPVQLTLAAAFEVTNAASADPARVAVVSLAPCQPGSADLYRWGQVVTAGMVNGNLGDTRMNPTQTLHAVDNLAMSAFAIRYGNHAYCLGLGGAAGQAWAGLEAVQERLAAGQETEALLMAGDQDCAEDWANGTGVALLFSASPKPYGPLGQSVRLVAVERQRRPHPDSTRPHAAAGLCGLLSALAAHDREGAALSYAVPLEDSDGVDAVTVRMEVSR